MTNQDCKAIIILMEGSFHFSNIKAYDYKENRRIKAIINQSFMTLPTLQFINSICTLYQVQMILNTTINDKLESVFELTLLEN